jgi:class 3 adenylate cyclase
MPTPPKVGLLQGGASALDHQGEHRHVTVLMTDLVGFTAFVEQAGEEGAFALVSQVSGLMTAAIHRHGGSVKNFTGDGVLALFGCRA